MDGKTAKSAVAEKQTGAKARKAKPLLDGADPLRSLKRVLDQVLLEGASMPAEIRQCVASARNACWEHFKKEEEALNAKTS